MKNDHARAPYNSDSSHGRLRVRRTRAVRSIRLCVFKSIFRFNYTRYDDDEPNQIVRNVRHANVFVYDIIRPRPRPPIYVL